MERRSNAAPLFVAIGLVVAMLGAYVSGYFWLCDIGYFGPNDQRRIVRGYPSHVLAEIYRPAAMIESAVSPRDVVTAKKPGPILPNK